MLAEIEALLKTIHKKDKALNKKYPGQSHEDEELSLPGVVMDLLNDIYVRVEVNIFTPNNCNNLGVKNLGKSK